MNEITLNDNYSFNFFKTNHFDLAERTHFLERKKTKKKIFTFIALFCGIGGIRQSFESVGGECVFSSDIDVFAQYTYYRNFDVVPFGDIIKLRKIKKKIPKHDLLCAGFPCQPFSHIGKREGFLHPTQGTMFHEILVILDKCRPKVVFLENVPGMANHDKGKTLEVILEQLKERGYTYSFKILDSYDFGVPQRRKRFYLVATRNGIKFNFPKPPYKHVDIGPFLETDVEGYSISKHLQNSYMFKVNDGRPFIVDKSTVGGAKTLVSTYHKIQRLTGTFVRDGPTGLRLLSENECKALMGFKRNFIFPVSRTQMYRQLGNSVVVPVVKRLAKEISLIEGIA